MIMKATPRTTHAKTEHFETYLKLQENKLDFRLIPRGFGSCRDREPKVFGLGPK